MDIAAWLGGLGLGQYEQAFRDNDIDGEVLRGLTADDLRELVVASVGFFGEAGIRRVRRGARSAASTPGTRAPGGQPAPRFDGDPNRRPGFFTLSKGRELPHLQA
jgi:hypothetical protein